MTLNKQKIYDYFILSARILLAFTFLNYGFGKLNGTQFGLTHEQLTKPIGELGLFKLSWYLFDQQPFKAFIGISQIIAALLLLFNRTLLLGALISIPILANILVIDITYLKMPAFYWRLSYYLFLDGMILWHYKDQIYSALKTLTHQTKPKFKFSIWAYLSLPIMAIILEILGIIPRLLINLFIHPSETIHSILIMPSYLMHLIQKLI